MKNKNDRIEKFRELINSPLSSGSAYAGMNMCDIYLNIRDREYVLDTIKYRFNKATIGIDSAEDWFEKLASLKNNDSYINAFVGQAAEYKAVERLEELGKSAELFESRIHPDVDLMDSDGIEWSVKSYGNISNLKYKISQHPNSTHYIINTESFEKFKSNGDLEEYAQKGITIIDGKFSHDEHLQLALDRINSVTGDITDEIYDGAVDDIPVVAGIFTFANIGTNLYKYSKDQVTKQEATTDIVKSISKLTVSAGGAATGAPIGGAIGSAIFPLAGTAIGAGVGALLGSIGARSLVDDYINSWKWKKSKVAYHYFAQKYSEGFSDDMLKRIKGKYYFSKQLKRNLVLEEKRLNKYKDELDLDNKTKATISAVLVDEVVKQLKTAIVKIETATDDLAEDIMDFCIKLGLTRYPREREKGNKYTTSLFGAIIAENSDWLLELDNEELSIIDDMKNEQSKYPKNPYKLKIDKEKLLGVLALLTLKSKGEKSD